MTGGHWAPGPSPVPVVAGPPVRVLYLHGLGCSTSIWEPAVAAAGPRIEPWVVRLPWHGLDDGGWSHRADPVALLAETLREYRPFDVVVAHSFAAMLLVEAVAAGLVEPVPAVLVSTFHRRDPDQFNWDTLVYYTTGFQRIFAEALRIGRDDIDPTRLDTASQLLRDRIGPYGWMRFFDAFLRSPFVDLAAVTAPHLVITGDEDIATRPADATGLAAALPHGRAAVLTGCGHFPMVEQPARFAAEVDAFLDQLTLTSRTHLEPI